MFKKNLFGFKSTERTPLKSVNSNLDKPRLTTASSFRTRLAQKLSPRPEFSLKPNLERKSQSYFSKNASVEKNKVKIHEKINSLILKTLKPNPEKSKRTESFSAKRNEFNKPSFENRIELSKSSFIVQKLPIPESDQSKPPNTGLQISQVETFEPTINPPQQNQEETSRIVNSISDGTGVSPELLIHEFQLENIKKANQITNLKLEIQNSYETEKQKTNDLKYLTQKNIELATCLAHKESEMINLKHQLSMSNQQTAIAKQQVLQGNFELTKSKEENLGLRQTNEINLILIDQKKGELEILTTKINKEKMKTETLSNENLNLESERELLLRIAEKFKLELKILKKSNEEALIFLSSKSR